MPTPLTEHNFKATELRLGLPGSDDSPDGDGAEDKAVYPPGALKTNVVSGAKRGFDEASGKWVFSKTNGSDVGLVGPGQAQNQQTGLALGSGSGGVSEGASPAAKAGMDNKKTHGSSPAAKAQVVGWPPIRSFRKNTMATNPQKNEENAEGNRAQVVGWPPTRSYRKNMMAANPQKNDENTEGKSGAGCLYVKVSMDGAPYLRKVDLETYGGYMELSSALEKMFSCFTIGQCGSHGVQGRDGLNESRLVDLLHGSEYVLTYEDKDGDWMLVGDVPWDMFTDSCKRMRIMKSSEAVGLAPRAMEKCKNRD